MTVGTRDEVDAGPANAKERAAMTGSIRQLSAAEREQMALSFYAELVARYPRVQRHFEGLDLKRLAGKLAATLNLLATHANDHEKLGLAVIRVGMAHRQRGIGYEDYAAFATVLADVLARSQSQLPTERALDFWTHELVAICEVMQIAADV